MGSSGNSKDAGKISSIPVHNVIHSLKFGSDEYGLDLNEDRWLVQITLFH